jgi:hypothetical protein
LKCPRHIILAIPFFLAACAPDDYRDDSFLHDPFRVKTVMQETLRMKPRAYCRRIAPHQTGSNWISHKALPPACVITPKPAPLMPPSKNRRQPGAKHKAATCRRYP